MSKEATYYQPIGDVYRVKFEDSKNFSWDQNVAVPYKAGVEEALRWLTAAYSGRAVREIIYVCSITHGAINNQEYDK